MVNGTLSSARGSRQQRLAGPGGADEQDVALGDLDVFLGFGGLEALVVVVHRDRQDLLGLLLADHVLIEALLISRLGQRLVASP
jgi:hypothetical protein